MRIGSVLGNISLGRNTANRIKYFSSLPLTFNLALGIQDTDIMAVIAKTEANGEPAGRSRGGGSGNNGRSEVGFIFSFHRQSSVTQ